ncbi:hypothetical protein MKW94_006175 [Papaver nudicaule]|uniref:SOSEKI DIX-like domain-containing protein n=1 Tax=Papaver nudicaule TaxID=74823 RepID=A0AA41RRZ8_PAPNU|nr:hypothetical protein [Papaver nudicaule]
MDIRNTTSARTRASAVRNRDRMSPERVSLSYAHHHHHHPQPQQPVRMSIPNTNVVMSKPFRKVQVLYYICRSNGQLEHPHFIEVTHLSTQHLRLKDFIDRLIVLRGRSMPSLFSWSCKRSYKNGYVWNDLSDNDIIYPADGAEYILKGSELIEGCSEQFQQIQVTTKKQNQEPKYHPKRRLLVVPSQNRESELGFMNRTDSDEEEEVRKNSTSSTKSSSQCSRGVSTEEYDELIKTQINNNPNEITVEDTTNYSPPSSSSTEKTQTTPKTDDHHDSVTEPTRSSVLFQLIACGSSNAIRERNAAAQKSIMPAPPVIAARKSNCSSNLHRGVMCKNINTAIKMSEEEEDDEINYMSENPRFGNPQSEEKEYFSGSIVESITEHDRVIGVTESSRLKKSSSYNEERSRKSGLGLEPISMDEKNEEEGSKKMMKKKNIKGHYCIPILTCNNK